ncbi:hypothetical protein AAMO2058_001355800 [Amorphochlora amoebiformis]
MMAPGTPLLLAVLWSVLGDGGVYLDRTGLRSSCGPAGAPHLSRSGKGSLRSHPLRSRHLGLHNSRDNRGLFRSRHTTTIPQGHQRSRTLTKANLNSIAASVVDTASSSAGWLLISLAVACHEGGHFLAALWQQMLIKEYSIGFGPRIFSNTLEGHNNITYSIRALPFGGYVSFPSPRFPPQSEDSDENANLEPAAVEDIRFGIEQDRHISSLEVERDQDLPEGEGAPTFDPDNPNLLENRPVGQQFLVAIGGIVANIMVAYMACVGAAFSGIPDPVYGKGVLIEQVDQGGRADKAGLKGGDIILGVGNQELGGDGVGDFVSLMSSNADQKLKLTVQREGLDHTKTLTVTPNSGGKILVRVKPNVAEMRRKKATEWKGIGRLAWSEMSRLTNDIVTGYASIFKDGAKPDLAGPIAMAQIGGSTVRTGDVSEDFLFFAALNLNLAAANALPIPGLDGAKMLSLLALALFGQPQPQPQPQAQAQAQVHGDEEQDQEQHQEQHPQEQIQTQAQAQAQDQSQQGKSETSSPVGVIPSGIGPRRLAFPDAIQTALDTATDLSTIILLLLVLNVLVNDLSKVGVVAELLDGFSGSDPTLTPDFVDPLP